MNHARFIFALAFAVLVLVLVNAGTTALADGIHWNPQITPGKLCAADDPNFTGYVYPARVAHCARAVALSMKAQVAQAYGVSQSRWSEFEFDHLIPLCAGGTNSPYNLWPEPLPHAEQKDKIENKICIGLRDGYMNQKQALDVLWNWLHENPEILDLGMNLESEFRTIR